MFVANVSVAEAAKRLSVGVPRIHQRIADCSLRAERIGSQWVFGELSLLRVVESKAPGRPLSARSAWTLIALAEGGERPRPQRRRPPSRHQISDSQVARSSTDSTTHGEARSTPLMLVLTMTH